MLGNATCNAPINVQAGQPGQNAVVSGGGGGGGGGGVEGGCGGGARFAHHRRTKPPDDRVRRRRAARREPGPERGGALKSMTLEGKNREDGYVVITYTMS